MNQMPELYISADSHVVEPKELWLTRMDKRFRGRAPRIQSRQDGDYFAIEGVEPFSISPLGAMIQDKVAGREVVTRVGKRAEDIRAGAWQAGARLADQQLDHIRAEVLYPGYGLVIFGAPDPEYQLACFQCYNDWLSDFCVELNGRALGAAVLPGNCPIELMIKEAQRIARKPGLRSVMLVNNPTGRPYTSPIYDPFWAAISELGLPIAIHMGTSTGEQLKDRIERFGGVYGVHLVDNRMGNAMRLIAQLIFGAVTQRFPRLRFVMVESGIGWIAGVLHFMDHWWTENRRWMEPRTDEKPSFFFKRNFWATFEDDRAGIMTRHLLNIDHLMWGSDYPHTEGTFPHSREQIARDFADVPAQEVCKMVSDNATAMYGFGQ